jgi:hypothetical protein
MRKTILAIGVIAVALPLIAQQQQAPQMRLPRVSQKQSVTQTIGLTDVTITYSRPGVKGRQIWGGLVPYDKVWRTGANEATTIAFSDDVTVNGQPLPKGSYSLHTIPGKDEWTIVFNNTSNQWGSFGYDSAKDALRIKVTPEKASYTEWLTFDVPELSSDNAKIVIRWENLAVPFTVGTGTIKKAMESARAAVAAAKPEDWQTPYRAANFAFENGDPATATGWLDQSMKAKETMAGLWLRARMQAKAGDRASAIKTGESALSKATPEDKDFAGEIQKTINLWKAAL